MSSPEHLDRRALTTAFVRARDLLQSSAQLDVSEVRGLEVTLRPLNGAWEIQQVVVPLLDRSGLFGLAMAWDAGLESKPQAWLVRKVDRWLALRGPEFAFLTLAELKRQQVETATLAVRCKEAIDAERQARAPCLQQNIQALGEVDAELAHAMARGQRSSVALAPLGTGLAEFAGLGQPCIQLWAITPDEAIADAERLADLATAYQDSFIAGVGDCSLPAAAVKRLGASERRVHVIDLQVSRLRALFELVDVSEALRARRLLLHVGTRAIETLGPYAKSALAHADAVAGGDNVALALLQAALERVDG